MGTFLVRYLFRILNEGLSPNSLGLLTHVLNINGFITDVNPE